MDSEVGGVLLTDGRYSILLHPPVSYPDGHGFHQQVDLVGGPFRGSINASSYEGPLTLRSFHEQLVALYDGLAGKAQLPDTYENLKVSLTGDGLGHIGVHVDAIAGDTMDTRLSFRFQIDQTYLPRIVAVIEEWLAAI